MFKEIVLTFALILSLLKNILQKKTSKKLKIWNLTVDEKLFLKFSIRRVSNLRFSTPIRIWKKKQTFGKTKSVISKTRSNTCCPRFECCVCLFTHSWIQGEHQISYFIFQYFVTEITDKFLSSHQVLFDTRLLRLLKRLFDCYSLCMNNVFLFGLFKIT